MKSSAESLAIHHPEPKLPHPVSERAVSLRRKMSPERWEREVRDARRNLQIVRRVERLYLQGYGPRESCLEKVAPDVARSTYLNWRRNVGIREGPRGNG